MSLWDSVAINKEKGFRTHALQVNNGKYKGSVAVQTSRNGTNAGDYTLKWYLEWSLLGPNVLFPSRRAGESVNVGVGGGLPGEPPVRLLKCPSCWGSVRLSSSFGGALVVQAVLDAGRHVRSWS